MMSWRRKQQRQHVRAIVKRPPRLKAPRMIVRRPESTGVHYYGAPSRRRGWRPSLRLSWRPGWRFYSAATTLGVIAVAGAGLYWAVTSPYFKVSTVTVEGNQVVATEILLERLDLSGESMFRIDLDEAQDALSSMPLVKSAQIERVWPDQIAVIVEERQPWGTWEQDGVAYTIDREGVVLGLLTPPAGSPVIRSAQHGTRQQGDRVDYQAVDAAAELYTKLPEVLGASVAEVAYLPDKGLVVRTAGGETAIFGDSSSIEYKLAVWAAMAETARGRHFAYSTIDLRFGNRPVLQ
jgi:cell division protein FtsQ